MGSVICQLTVSLDGFVAGPDQRPDEPLGTGGERLHEWAFAGEAGQKVLETSAVLREGEDVLRGWLRAAEATRQRLADWDAR